MNVLIVYAHPEPRSFNGALRDCAVETLTSASHAVEVSDLYAMRFQPVDGPGDFMGPRLDPQYLKMQVEQKHAYESGTLVADISAEQEKLLRCDTLVLQFPLYWFSMPAILKGWVDRVMTTGFAYGGGRWFDRGGLAGRRAMLSLTTGGPPSNYAPDGLMGDIDWLLWPIQNGILRFVGFEVLPPFIAFAAARVSDAERAGYLAAFRERLLSLDRTEPLFFHPLHDFGEDRRLKPGLKALTGFQRDT